MLLNWVTVSEANNTVVPTLRTMANSTRPMDRLTNPCSHRTKEEVTTLVNRPICCKTRATNTTPATMPLPLRYRIRDTIKVAWMTSTSRLPTTRATTNRRATRKPSTTCTSATSRTLPILLAPVPASCTKLPTATTVFTATKTVRCTSTTPPMGTSSASITLPATSITTTSTTRASTEPQHTAGNPRPTRGATCSTAIQTSP